MGKRKLTAQLGIAATLALQSGVLAATATHVVPLPPPLPPPATLVAFPEPVVDVPAPPLPLPPPLPPDPEPVEHVPPTVPELAHVHTSKAAL